jgi:hypothetical protein
MLMSPILVAAQACGCPRTDIRSPLAQSGTAQHCGCHLPAKDMGRGSCPGDGLHPSGRANWLAEPLRLLQAVGYKGEGEGHERE